MNNSIKDYHKRPTYDELIQEAIIHPTDIIKYPNRIATQLRNTPQLSRFDDENFLDTNIFNSNAMKQNMQQTALQKATQPVSRYIKTGLEQFDIHDTDDAIQDQMDDNTADLKNAQSIDEQKANDIIDRVEKDLSKPTQIHTIIQGNLRGASSASSRKPPEDYKPDDIKESSKASLRGSSSSAAAAILDEDDTPPPVKHIISKIEIEELDRLAYKRIRHLTIDIKAGFKKDEEATLTSLIYKEREDIEAILLRINKLKTKKFKKNRTPQAIEDLNDAMLELRNILNKSKWQIEGLPKLSDKEGLDRAYNNNENLYYDGNENLYIAGTNSIKDLVINDLTIPFRGLIQYTDRYNKAHQLYTDNKDNIKTIISHSLGSVLAHHIVL